MFYIFNVLYFVHSHDCDESAVTVIFLGCNSDSLIYDRHFFDFKRDWLYFDSDFSHFGRDM